MGDLGGDAASLILFKHPLKKSDCKSLIGLEIWEKQGMKTRPSRILAKVAIAIAALVVCYILGAFVLRMKNLAISVQEQPAQEQKVEAD